MARQYENWRRWRCKTWSASLAWTRHLAARWVQSPPQGRCQGEAAMTLLCWLTGGSSTSDNEKHLPINQRGAPSYMRLNVNSHLELADESFIALSHCLVLPWPNQPPCQGGCSCGGRANPMAARGGTWHGVSCCLPEEPQTTICKGPKTSIIHSDGSIWPHCTSTLGGRPEGGQHSVTSHGLPLISVRGDWIVCLCEQQQLPRCQKASGCDQ